MFHLHHDDLHQLCSKLRAIHSSAASFEPPTSRLPIIDASTDIEGDDEWKQQENISGMRLLRDAVKGDLERLKAFLADPNSANLPALSTNSPYLISVWNEVMCAPSPLVSIFRTFPTGTSGAEVSLQNGKHARKDTGIKVDVICDGGRQWIRVNTIKNSRLLAEFREIDSYLTDSSDSDVSNVPRPSLVQKEFDNCVLRMARSLLLAANQNLIPGSNIPPRVTLRLTRLEPTEEGVDPRIAKTVHCLLDMGIDVQLGERGAVEMPLPSSSSSKSCTLEPTTRINLDLSILIALISDLTHADLPNSLEEADTRFLPSKKYLEWKMRRISQGFSISGAGKNKQKGSGKEWSSSNASANANEPHRLPADKPWKNVHARALAHQLKQETKRGLFQDMSERLSAITPPLASAGTTHNLKDVEFWTTQDAKDRCLRIVSKIGGPNEHRRASILFSTKSTSVEKAEEQYWFQSRHPPGYVPLLPLRIYPSHEPHAGLQYPLELQDPATLSPFFGSLAQTCRRILSSEILPHPRALPDHLVEGDADGEIQRAEVTKANPKLTAHTVQSMLWGAELGWTTLTANKSSVKAILKEMKQQSHSTKVKELAAERTIHAALWVVDPRSLAEGQRADLDDE